MDSNNIATAKEITFYQVDEIRSDFESSIRTYIKSLAEISWEIQSGVTETAEAIAHHVFVNPTVSKFLIFTSRLPVFSKDVAKCFKDDLDSLRSIKQLKYFYNQPFAAVVQQLADLVSRATSDASILSKWHYITNVVLKSPLATTKVRQLLQQIGCPECYQQNFEYLEEADPHAVYPTSMYGSCDGFVLAKPDASVVESCMYHTLTTTIKIVNNVLDPENNELRNVYQPLGRCVAIIDDKVEKIYGKVIQKYFNTHGIELSKLIFSGNEVNKHISTVEKMIIGLQRMKVVRNQPVLLVGGGVISDTAGFATGLYHRNTPYIMLCTSVVAGVDSGLSPRRGCDGFGFKNLFGSFHPPVLALVDRSFYRTLRHGWLRHGIAEIVKMAVVKDKDLFCLLEKVTSALVWTKFGTEVENYEGDSKKLGEECDLIIGKAVEGYVRSEYGNLWDSHQCRPHAYGHTWSPGYEIPSGMLHGHAVAAEMGFSAYLSFNKKWITYDELNRILKLISDLELSLWHPIMEDARKIFWAQEKIIEKRGGNLAAPIPRGIGKCGYLNDLPFELLEQRLKEYHELCQKLPRQGLGIEVHCKDVGLDDPATVGAINMELPEESFQNGYSKDAIIGHSQDLSYNEWIEVVQKKRINDALLSGTMEKPKESIHPPEFGPNELCHTGVENYACDMTQPPSQDIRKIVMETEQQQFFSPCMVGPLESQFLKMMTQISNAKRVLDIGTFTGMSAMAFAEGLPHDGQVVTLEFDPKIGATADNLFKASSQAHKITLKIGDAKESMEELRSNGEKFDMIFLDAAKDEYVLYYQLAMKMLTEKGLILADNTMCPLLYDKDDPKRQALHDFNEMVKKDPRVEQVVLTFREGVSIIRPKNP